MRSLSLTPLLLIACTAQPDPMATPTPVPSTLPEESDLPPMWEGTWKLDCGATLRLEKGGRLFLETSGETIQLTHDMTGVPAMDAQARRVVYSHAPVARPETVISAISCEDGTWSAPRLLEDGPGSPDRPAISPDGGTVAWVSGRTGIASIWTARWDGTERAQLTNAGLDLSLASPGNPPPGFIPLPHRGPPQFHVTEPGALLLRWDGPQEPVELPIPVVHGELR